MIRLAEQLWMQVRRLGAGRIMLCLVLFSAPWHFKALSSLSRFLDVTRWWAPALFPETLVTLAAAIVSLVILPHARRRGRIPGASLVAGSFGLCLASLVLSSVMNERNTVYLVRVIVLQYALPCVVFWLVLRHVDTVEQLRALTTVVIAGGGLLFLVATPVYFTSFSHFPPSLPTWWPASRALYNRMVFPLVHNDPRMLYDNVTFGNPLNTSQLLVVLLPLALGVLFAAATVRVRVMAAGAASLFALHLILCYSRGPLVVTVATLAFAWWLVWKRYPTARTLGAASLVAWAALTFVGPDIPGYWLSQFSVRQDSTAFERLNFLLRPLGFRDASLPQTVSSKSPPSSPRPPVAAPPAVSREPSSSPRAVHPPQQIPIERYLVVGVGSDAYVRMALVGLGYGNYGKLIGRIPGSGTHNMFLNALVNTGLLGLLGLLGLIVWAGSNVWRSLAGSWGWAPFDPAKPLALFLGIAFGNVVVVGILSLYEFEYLGTGTGATLFAFLLAVSARLVTIAGESLRRVSLPP
jgi:hypothetical protein